MDKTLLGVIVGGVIALLPSLASTIVAIVNERQKQKHEMEMKRVEWESAAKIEAIRQYSDSIGACIASGNPETYRVYMANLQRLSLYVSEETYQAMLKIDDPRQLDPGEHDLRNLSALLRAEMLAASSSHAPTCDHQQKRTCKATQKLHHFLSQCRAAIIPHPTNPADPVERGADCPQHKR